MRKPPPPPAEEPHVLFNRQRNKADVLRRNTLVRIDDDQKAFEALVAEWDASPVVVLPISLTNHLLNYYRIDLVKILQDRAKAADRIFIAIRQQYSGDVHMTVKNTGRTAQLVSNLLLIAKPLGVAGEPLTVDIKAKSWDFRFVGAKGRNLLDAWIEHCRTDIRAQFALNFGPAANRMPEIDAEDNFKCWPSRSASAACTTPRSRTW